MRRARMRMRRMMQVKVLLELKKASNVNIRMYDYFHGLKTAVNTSKRTW